MALGGYRNVDNVKTNKKAKKSSTISSSALTLQWMLANAWWFHNRLSWRLRCYRKRFSSRLLLSSPNICSFSSFVAILPLHLSVSSPLASSPKSLPLLRDYVQKLPNMACAKFYTLTPNCSTLQPACMAYKCVHSTYLYGLATSPPNAPLIYKSTDPPPLHV